MKTAVGIIGVTGYTGQELLTILLRHPDVSVRYLASRRLRSPVSVGDLLPSFRGSSSLRVYPFKLKEALDHCDLLFLTLPHGVAMEWIPRILRKPALRVVDLSGDFRLKSASIFKQAYGQRHTSPGLLRSAVYGLSEWCREAVRGARLVSNPGCYPTATLLSLGPLAKEGLLASQGLIVDAKSGVTGAGRSPKEELLFSEVNENLRAYNVNAHPHIPEMEQTLSEWAGGPIRMLFVPHLVPLNRGLYATVYASLKRRVSEKRVRKLYDRSYSKEPFIKLLPEGVWPQTRSVMGTNNCEINLRVDSNGQRVILLSAIDNLGKGAAGQAVQNMNLMYGFPETAALVHTAGES